ncbi:hypothetical protein ACETIH_17615 [Microvirga arabica]|uniref:Right handed beta helix domain-containing protein n=1 Tax=Microvirga arabica TaxID=1128671 RepID=A0ABV6YB77_9HYPH
MNRRDILSSLLSVVVVGRTEAGTPSPEHTTMTLKASGPVNSRADGDVIEGLDVTSRSGSAIGIKHKNVKVRNCRIRHAGGNGIAAKNAPGLLLEGLDIQHIGAPASGESPNDNCNNIDLENCPGAVITRIRAARGSANIYLLTSGGSKLSFLELHDARGPLPRGQNMQFDKSPNSVLADFSAENGPSSWTEDNISVFQSDRCIVRRGLVSYNNSPTGFGVMVEGSFDCLIEDIDAVQQGNGAFSAVTLDDTGSGGCIINRCRTRDSYNSTRDGRDAPSSNSLSIYTSISPGARKHTITNCEYFNLANPDNLIWQMSAIRPGWSFRLRDFETRPPVRLVFPWDAANTDPDQR